MPLHRLSLDADALEGTTVTLEALRKTFSLADIERFIRERLPIQAPHFAIVLNGKRLEPVLVAGKKFPVNVNTPYGSITGELILPNFPKGEAPGIECVVRSVVVCRSTFGFDFPILSRLRGRISADFLPITSDRSRFIVDSPEYKAFLVILYKEIRHIDRLAREAARERSQRKADDALKDTLSRVRRAIRRNPDIAPGIVSPLGEINAGRAENGAAMAPQAASSDSDAVPAFQASIPLPGSVGSRHGQGQSEIEPPARKVRVKSIQGKTVTARRITIGGLGITCALENCGRDQPPAFTEGGIIFINADHPLYRRQQERGQEILGFYLTCLLSQQMALLLAGGDARRAFAMQDRLLTDSW